LGQRPGYTQVDQRDMIPHERSVILGSNGELRGDWADSEFRRAVLAGISRPDGWSIVTPKAVEHDQFQENVAKGCLNWTEVSVVLGSERVDCEISVFGDESARRIGVRNINTLDHLLASLPERQKNRLMPELGFVNEEGLHSLVEQSIDALHCCDLYQSMVAAHISNNKDLQVVLGQEGYINWLSMIVDRIQCAMHENSITVCIDRNTIIVLFAARFTSRELCLSYSTSVGQRIRFLIENDAALESELFHPKVSYTALPLGDSGQIADEILAFSKSDLVDTFNVDGGVRQLSISYLDARKKKIAFERSVVVALRNDEFYVVFQPKVDMLTGEWVGAEALLRWTHQGEPVSPALFVDTLDHLGKLSELTQTLVVRLVDQVAAWYDDGLWGENMVLSINLSPKSFLSDTLVRVLAGTLASVSLPSRLIELEVTEGQFISDFERARVRVEQIRALGVRVALDDFGTGYSALSYLQRLQFDTLKIDRSFVESMVSNHVSRTIVRAVVDICEALNMEPIAEGVETLEEESCLVGMGCYVAQGFLYARPLDQETFHQELIAKAMINRESPNDLDGEHRRNPY